MLYVHEPCGYISKGCSCNKKAVGMYRYNGYVIYLCTRHKNVFDEYDLIDRNLLAKAIICMGRLDIKKVEE